MQSVSITTRISLLFAALVVLVLVVMGYVILASVTHHFEEQDRMALQGKLALVQNILNEALPGNANHEIQSKLKDALVGHHELSLQISDDAGRSIFVTHHANFISALMDPLPEYSPRQSLALISQDINRRHYHMVAVAMKSRVSLRRYRVAIALDVGHHQLFLDTFTRQLIVTGSAGLLLMVLLGWLAARHGLRPIHDMAQVAEGISAQKIKERLPSLHLPTELRSLAASFNGMLDRLEEALSRLSDFSSDIAHELRTPVNNLMTQTQVCLSKDRTLDEYRDVLFSNMEEYERLARMISDMLFLAKADNGQIVPHVEKINFSAEVKALFEFYDALAAEKQLRLEMVGDAEAVGDRLMLRRVLSNLLSNAIRHATPATLVKVALEYVDAHAQVRVSNHGETLSNEVLSRIFERFYRGDISRYRVDEGAGLGLAISRSIVYAHKGRISAVSEEGITTFCMDIPKSIEL